MDPRICCAWQGGWGLGQGGNWQCAYYEHPAACACHSPGTHLFVWESKGEGGGPGVMRRSMHTRARAGTCLP